MPRCRVWEKTDPFISVPLSQSGCAFVSGEAVRFLLEKLLGKRTTTANILVLVRLICLWALQQNRLAHLPQNEFKLWKKAPHRFEFSQHF